MTPRFLVALVGAAGMRRPRFPASVSGPDSTSPPFFAPAVSGRRVLPVLAAFERRDALAGAFREDDSRAPARLPVPDFASPAISLTISLTVPLTVR